MAHKIASHCGNCAQESIYTTRKLGNQQAAGPSRSRRAPRNSACLNCRKRKHKCDGVRPTCGPCIRSLRGNECIYLESPRPSRQQALEQQIIRLQERLSELGQTDGDSLSDISGEQQESPTPSVSPYDATSSNNHDSGALVARYLGQATASMSISVSSMPEPSSAAVQSIVNAFLVHSDQVGFFLDKARFSALVFLARNDARLSPALRDAVYLWGVHFSATDALAVYGPVLLTRAVQALNSASVNMAAFETMQIVQAQILVSNYHFSFGRMVEGKYFCDAAAILALSCHLYRNGFSQTSHTLIDVDNSYNPSLRTRNDTIEPAEHSRARWHLYVLEKCWAAILHSSSRIHGTSGPFEADEYGVDIPSLQGVPLSVASGHGQDNVNDLILQAKAAALFERATRLTAEWTADTDLERYAIEFVLLDDMIDRFITMVEPMHTSSGGTMSRTLLTTLTLAHAATIRLHEKLQHSGSLSGKKDVRAAKAASVALVSIASEQLPFLNPIITILWTIVCRVLVREKARLRELWTSSSAAQRVLASEASLQTIQAAHADTSSVLSSLTAVMSVYGRTSPFMATQAIRMQQESA
ncbi:uncharacterized protein LAESUDRAFT_168775 [Laetiporus sulphureus 93-53]|uniref:Zn(2)-C6 fungal-type domain-containing protein n=1 Tax=Laetiporus sulphureus 93-53 TaxID=1314785 RepID=A0A165HT39_9APHY|nr:uncharacterized protein LAESUDRAFT_168775 [Laetiporus sulphureus 93-53]KZT12150.1 hypothetical protein LAESUDRAFT_168775 [Laetiporus sulphureus 93-53]